VLLPGALPPKSRSLLHAILFRRGEKPGQVPVEASFYFSADSVNRLFHHSG
jgi:hypothetical protein